MFFKNFRNRDIQLRNNFINALFFLDIFEQINAQYKKKAQYKKGGKRSFCTGTITYSNEYTNYIKYGYEYDKLYTEIYEKIIVDLGFASMSTMDQKGSAILRINKITQYNRKVSDFILEDLLKDINEYITEIFEKYKFIMLLPKDFPTDFAGKIDIKYLSFIFFLQDTEKPVGKVI